MNKYFKTNIRKLFNDAKHTYDVSCNIQNRVAKECIEMLIKNRDTFNTVGDFACGTGANTLILLDNIKYSRCLAADMSDALIKIARDRLNARNIHFLISDIDNYIFKNNIFNLIFCNMGLQWSSNIENTIKIFNYYLQKKGILAFSIPEKDNFPELKTEYKISIYSSDIVKKILSSNNYNLIRYHFVSYTTYFESAYLAVKSIKSIGANFYPNRLKHTVGLSKSSCDKFFHNTKNISLTYKIGIYLAAKNND
ncbi:MAG: methyltransferase domain-containing protein [Legionellales bacterium]|nr:methyltransferase domain-containing protein [Legionellales bacterium]